MAKIALRFLRTDWVRRRPQQRLARMSAMRWYQGLPSVSQGLPATWLNTIWLNFFVESSGLKILSLVTTKSSQLHSNSRNKYVNSRKYHNVGRVGGSRSKERDRKSELVLRSRYQIFEWDRNNSDLNFYNVVRYVHIPLVP